MNYLQKVKCKAKLKRKHSIKMDVNNSAFATSTRKWARIESNFDGVVIGKRNLCNGEVDFDPEQTAFIPKEYFTAYLVSLNMNENPVYVLPEDITKL